MLVLRGSLRLHSLPVTFTPLPESAGPRKCYTRLREDLAGPWCPRVSLARASLCVCR